MTAHRKDPAAIEAEIRATQAGIDRTIEDLKMQLSPAELMHRAVDLVRDNGGEMGRNAARKVRDNPLPVALMASAMAWLMMSDARSGGPVKAAQAAAPWDTSADYAEHREAISLHDRIELALSSVAKRFDETRESFEERLEEARASAMGLSREIGEETHAFKDRVERAFSSLMHRAATARKVMAEHVASAVHTVASGAEEGGAYVRDRAASLETLMENMFARQPLVVGAVGVALGALAGSLIPETRRENDLLGGLGGALRRDAGKVASSAADAVETAASRVGHTVHDIANDEGLTRANARKTAADLVSAGERIAGRVVQTVKDEASGAISRGLGGSKDIDAVPKIE